MVQVMLPTYNAAATAVVQARRHLHRARENLGVAVRILGEMDGPHARPLSRRIERVRLAGALEDHRVRLDATAQAIEEAWPKS